MENASLPARRLSVRLCRQLRHWCRLGAGAVDAPWFGVGRRGGSWVDVLVVRIGRNRADRQGGDGERILACQTAFGTSCRQLRHWCRLGWAQAQLTLPGSAWAGVAEAGWTSWSCGLEETARIVKEVMENASLPARRLSVRLCRQLRHWCRLGAGTPLTLPGSAWAGVAEAGWMSWSCMRIGAPSQPSGIGHVAYCLRARIADGSHDCANVFPCPAFYGRNVLQCILKLFVWVVKAKSESSAPTLTRAELVDTLYYKIGFSKRETRHLVDMILEEIVQELENGKSVKLSFFGSFLVRGKKARVGRNPRTGEEALIGSRKVLSFVPSRILRRRISDTCV